jgi:hypothetical protein
MYGLGTSALACQKKLLNAIDIRRSDAHVSGDSQMCVLKHITRGVEQSIVLLFVGCCMTSLSQQFDANAKDLC